MDDNQSPAPPKVADLGAHVPLMTFTHGVMALDGVTETGWRIVLAGPAHPRTLESQDKALRLSLKRDQLREQAQVNGRKYKGEDKDPDDARRENVEWLVSRIVDWSPVHVFDRDWPFTDADAVELLLKPEMGFVRVQLIDRLTEDATFMRRSATTSSTTRSATSS
ncbi:MAG: hypothetical protein AB7O45_12040 [Alphaproteobacteria bacterium]